MGNIIIAIKRFFQNKNTVTIFAILVAVGIIYFAYNFRIKRSTEPVNVPYAVKEIGPRTLITNDMVSTKKVPGGIVTKNVITNSANIVGKYVVNTAVIPEGSMFYQSTVVEWEDLKRSIAQDIPDKETLFRLPVDMDSTYGNSIFKGNRIDIYFKTERKDTDGQDKVWIGKFIEGIEVYAVTDAEGKSVFETAGDPSTPKYLQFNVNVKIFKLLTAIQEVHAESSITLFPVPRNANYSSEENKVEPKIKGEEFVEYVKQFIDQHTLDDIEGGEK